MELRRATLVPGEVFRDCEACPEMVVLPGSLLALGRYEVTLGEYRAFASATGGGAAADVPSLVIVTTAVPGRTLISHRRIAIR